MVQVVLLFAVSDQKHQLFLFHLQYQLQFCEYESGVKSKIIQPVPILASFIVITCFPLPSI